MMVAIVYVLMVPQGLLIITLIIIIHVATRQRCVHAYVPPVTVKNIVYKIVISHDSYHLTFHETGPGQSHISTKMSKPGPAELRKK